MINADDIIIFSGFRRLKENGLSSAEQIYMPLQAAADKILRSFYGGAPTFSIDIRGIVKEFGLKICETNLNVDCGFTIEKINGYLRRSLSGEFCINLHCRDSIFAKRYVLAHEFCRYILSQAQHPSADPAYARNYADPLFTKDPDTILAEIMSAFLLFPPECVLASLEKYAAEMRRRNEYPLNASDWLRFLSQEGQISVYYTTSSYQHLKLYFCILQNSDPQNDLIQKHPEFFR